MFDFPSHNLCVYYTPNQISEKIYSITLRVSYNRHHSLGREISQQSILSSIDKITDNVPRDCVFLFCFSLILCHLWDKGKDYYPYFVGQDT